MQFQGKRFTGILFFVLALAEAPDERLHAATDHLAAKAEQRKSGQLGIGRHPVRIDWANRIAMYNTGVPPDIRTIKNTWYETQEQRHGRGDENNARQPLAQNAMILCILLPLANALDEQVGKTLRQTNIHAPANRLCNLLLVIRHRIPPFRNSANASRNAAFAL